MKRILTLTLSVILGVCATWAQEAPQFHIFSFEDQALVRGMSDNGKYAVAHGTSVEDATIAQGARLIEIDTEKVTDLAANYTANDYVSMATADVTDDGSIVVGSLDFHPAYWSKSTGKWTVLPCEDEEYYGDVFAVTPDGKYAVGRQSMDQDGFYSLPALWDLTTNKLVETAGIPEFDLSGTTQDQNWFNQITADGKYILGNISYSYVGSGFYYIYSVEEETFKPIGYTLEGKKFTPTIDDLHFINGANFSNNGEWVTGRAYIVEEADGAIANQYETTYRYNVATEAVDVYRAAEDVDIVSSAIDNSGHALGATPSGTPIRNWSIREGNYWYSFDQILKQKYNINFTARTGYDNTGTVLFVANDEKRAAVMIDPYTSYVVDMPEKFGDLCKGIDLLGSYTTSPREGVTISRLKEVTINFDRDIQVLGENNCALLRDASGKTVYNSVGVAANKKKLTVRYRSGALTAGETYTLHIPAGALALSEDATLTNKEINITYKGRADEPVAPANIFPAENASVTVIDNSINPITINYNVEVYAPDSAKAYLYKVGEEEPICQLLVAYLDTTVCLFPTTPQYLFLDNDYRVELLAGSVTDVAGNGPCEKLVINYKGSYEREIVYDDNSLFIETFNYVGVANMLLWDGDLLTPGPDAQAIGFDRNDYGWCIVWDEDGADIAASSHSMYTPAGKSDDWMVLPQLSIPDEKCTLNFKSQSYKNGKKDYLKVYVLEHENIITSLNKEFIDLFKSEGELIYNELQTPGKDEGSLANDWTENIVKLEKYAGKHIYIAFVNDNEDQSAVFVDDIIVSHNKPVRVAFTNETSLVQEEGVVIEGVLSIQSESEAITALTFTLLDSEGSEVDKIEATGLTLENGDTYEFAFTKELPLETGVTNRFKVVVAYNETSYEFESAILNLAFEPVKRVVLEEISGRTCSNCPLGFLAIDKLHDSFGDLIIPICIRTFGDDPLGTGLADYTAALGMSAAPSGVINRKVMSMPAVSSNNNYYFSNTLSGTADKVWFDVVNEELSIPAEADINITLSMDKEKNELIVPVTVRYALNAKNLNLNLFAVVMEDYVETWQMNGFAALDIEVLGEWGKNGEYGKTVVYDYSLLDVCRSYHGTTISGTSGLLPQEMEAGKEYTTELRLPIAESINSLSNSKVAVMLIDGNTGVVINATLADEIAAVEHIDNDNNVAIIANNGNIVVNTQDDAQVEVYGMNGMLQGTAQGNGIITLDAPAGIAIVKVITGESVVVKKVIVQ